jgi:hypothetical protein
MSNDRVHSTHCCASHGCKYGKDGDCPVVSGRIVQEYPCEECGDIIQPKWGFWQPIAVYDQLKVKPKRSAFRFAPVNATRSGGYVTTEVVEFARHFGSRVCTHWIALPDTDNL